MSLPEYIGHLHPVLVHLPIGILLAAILFQWLSTRKGFRKLRKSIGLLLFLGFVSAAFSAFTGYLLAQSGDYDASLLKTHQWLGIIVAVLSLIVLLIRKRKDKEAKAAYSLLVVALAILILLTGHFGGSLTHGSDFVSPAAVTSWFGDDDSSSLPADLKSAFLYKDLVEPIFKTRCVRCHGATRQKGKLRLDKPEYILKGGKDGVILTAVLDESEVFKRIHLPLEDEDHMPPKEKSQLDKRQIAILTFWIATGGDFKEKLGALPRGDSLIAWIRDPGASDPVSDEVVEIVSAPDSKTIEALRTGGVAVSFLSEGNGAISLNFMNADTAKISSLISQLPIVQRQLLHLKFEGCRLSSGDWNQVGKLTSLTRLSLARSNVTDADLIAIHSLPKLEYLNLVGTSISTPGLDALKPLSSLKKLYLFNTQVKPPHEEAVRKALPKVTVDFGNYQVPTLAADTVELKKAYTVPPQ